MIRRWIAVLMNAFWFPLIGENLFYEMPIEDCGLDGDNTPDEGSQL